MSRVDLLEPLRWQPSRLRALGYEQRDFITIAIAKPYLDAVEDLIAPVGRTRIAAMPRDILVYVLQPYLWVGDRLCDVKHRNGWRYGVVHGIETDSAGGTMYRCYGLLHRVGAPAVVQCKGRMACYYQNGQRFRESGPDYVTETMIGYKNGSRWNYMTHESTHVRMDISKRLSVTRYPDGRVHISVLIQGTRIMIFIGDGKLLLPNRSSIRTHLFDEILAALGEYVVARDIPGEIAREWARTQAEIASD